ncbi:hypothetical protein KR084_005477 [Drosophila pseudotakahashii]|nr:hypothetical protein KR084_005477 [Drosophila pseudotakahashii]
MTVESFLFRVERLQVLYRIEPIQVFREFHSLLVGAASKWYWQLMEDRADDYNFDYYSLTTEMKRAFSSSGSDLMKIKELMERRQGQNESFSDYVSDMHNLHFRLQNKLEEDKFVELIKDNLNAQMGSLLLTSPIRSLADLNKEGSNGRAARSRPVSELEDYQTPQDFPDAVTVEEFNRKRRDTRSGLENGQGCRGPHHELVCYKCGKSADFYRKHPKEDPCLTRFHDATCRLCERIEGDADANPAAFPRSPQISPHKSLEQREREYELARQRIFQGSEDTDNTTRDTRKMPKLYDARAEYRKLKQKVVDTVVSIQNDNRFFAKTKVDEREEILALLDTGASANCIGRGAEAFLRNRTRPIRKLNEECVRTASGGETRVVGAITLPVEWEGEIKDLEFLIVPGLTQRFYFGINFWDTFGLTFLGKGGNEFAAIEAPPEYDLMTGDLDMNDPPKPETAYTPHQLSPEQHSKLRQMSFLRGRVGIPLFLYRYTIDIPFSIYPFGFNILDSGASDHLINDESLFIDSVELVPPLKIAVAKQGEYIYASKRGIVRLRNNHEITLEDVLYSEQAAGNLMSVKRLQEAGMSIKFDKNGVTISKNGLTVVKNSETIATAFWTHWIARFGAPKTITTDQGTQFKAALTI